VRAKPVRALADTTALPLGDALDLMRRLWVLNHELERLSARVLRRLGVTAQQRMMLRIIGRFPGITSGRLSGVLSVDAATVSTALARLERRGLLRRERDSVDRRRVAVALTEAGRVLDTPATGTIEAAIVATFERVPSSDVAATRRVLDTLAVALQEQERVDARPPAKRARRGK
jgi:DNA-binding MarR family transcriptional regulator